MASQPMAVDDGLDVEALVSFLKEEETKSQDEYLDQERANALDFYNGEPFGDEEEGRSQVVTRDVAEVIDYMTVSLLRTMVSGDKVVEFDHLDPEIAQQATAAVTQEFYQGQDGYRVLHDWIKAGLLEKTSVAKCCIEERPPRRVELTMPPEVMVQLEQEGGQIIAADPVDIDPTTGEPTAFHVAALVPQPPRFRDYVTPNEEIGLAPDMRDMDDDAFIYVSFRRARTLSDLAKDGFDTTDLSGDAAFSSSDQILATARDQGISPYWQNVTNREGANRKVWHREEYVTYDLNGDGIAELLLVHRVDNTILSYKDGSYAIEEIDQQPGVAWCPFPMPHRIVGQSLADKVLDIQRVRSVLMRQGLDNLYQTNAPRMAISESAIGDTTLDDLLTVRANGIIRYVGAQKPEPVTLPFAADAAFQVMEVFAGEKESRTGITRLNQGLDADALNKTATGTALMQASGQQIEEYLARNFAEAFARLMLKKYHLMRKFGRPMRVVIDGETVTIDPRQWPDDMNAVVRVGLGSGRKDQRIQYRMMLLQVMQAAAQGGSRTVTDENVYAMLKGLAADMNLDDVRDILTDPSQLPPQPDKPDPEMAKAQAGAMIDARKQQASEVQMQADHMLAAQKMQNQYELDQQALAAKLEGERQKTALEQELARDKAVFEANLAKETADRQFELDRLQIERNHELQMRAQEMTLHQNRPGGDLDE